MSPVADIVAESGASSGGWSEVWSELEGLGWVAVKHGAMQRTMYLLPTGDEVSSAVDMKGRGYTTAQAPDGTMRSLLRTKVAVQQHHAASNAGKPGAAGRLAAGAVASDEAAVQPPQHKAEQVRRAISKAESGGPGALPVGRRRLTARERVRVQFNEPAGIYSGTVTDAEPTAAGFEVRFDDGALMIVTPGSHRYALGEFIGEFIAPALSPIPTDDEDGHADDDDEGEEDEDEEEENEEEEEEEGEGEEDEEEEASPCGGPSPNFVRRIPSPEPAAEPAAEPAVGPRAVGTFASIACAECTTCAPGSGKPVGHRGRHVGDSFLEKKRRKEQRQGAAAEGDVVTAALALVDDADEVVTTDEERLARLELVDVDVGSEMEMADYDLHGDTPMVDSFPWQEERAPPSDGYSWCT